MYYNFAGKGEKALELVSRTLSTTEIPHSYLTEFHMYKAWALILLGQIEEARDEFEEYQEFALKSGETHAIVRLELLEGLLDKAENNSESASVIFEKLLKSFKNDPMPLFENICLLNLVEIEIETQPPEAIHNDADSSGDWMDTLEDRISKFDFPGIAAQTKLLKAKFREKQGRNKDVQLLLNEVLKASKSSSMSYLKILAKKYFPELVHV
jgi:hypothetical protein